jgi:hypothetical protein
MLPRPGGIAGPFGDRPKIVVAAHVFNRREQTHVAGVDDGFEVAPRSIGIAEAGMSAASGNGVKASLGRRRRLPGLVLRDSPCDRTADHVHTAVETGAIRNHHAFGDQGSVDFRIGCELDAVASGD